MTGFIIRPSEGSADYRLCADIWLEASLQAHDFISPEIWRRSHESMASEYLPESEVFIADLGLTQVAFAAVRGFRLAALFVLPKFWGRGLGRALIEQAARNRSELQLSVYQKNERALEFYLGQGFVVTGQGPCPHSGELELTMIKKAPAVAGEG